MFFNMFTFILIVFIAIVAVIQVYRIISGSDKRQVELFARYQMHAAGMGYFGSVMSVAVVFILFPHTFLIGTLMLAFPVGWIVLMRLSVKDYSGAFSTMCYLLLIVLMGYCKYPRWLTKICPENCGTIHARAKPVAVCGGPARP